MVLRPFSRHTVLRASYIVIILATSFQITHSEKNSFVEIAKNLSTVNQIANNCEVFTIRNPNQREFFSPGYPGPYTPQTICTTRIDVPYPNTIQVEFKGLFKIEKSEGCEYDGLMIRDGPYGFSKLVGKFCGSEVPKPISSSGQSLWLKFYSDMAFQLKGFQATYKIIKQEAVRPKIEECYLDVGGDSGEIKLSDIPYKFLNYSKHWNIPLTCIWRIKVKLNTKIHLKLSKDSSIQSKDCDENFLAALSKELTSDNILWKFCGESLAPITVSENIAHLIFLSQPQNLQYFHFVIQWTSIDSQTKSSQLSLASTSEGNYTSANSIYEGSCFSFNVKSKSQKELTSPGYPKLYRPMTNCVTRIEAPYPDTIELDFRETFDIEYSQKCEYDGLKIRDGPYGFSKEINTFCGDNYPPIIKSTGQYLWLQFYTDSTIQMKGFKAVYKFNKGEAVRPKIEDCRFDETGNAGEISIQDIPEKFLNYTKQWDIPLMCIWKIRVKPKWEIYIAFKEFSLVVPNACEKNFIDIRRGDLLSDQGVETFCSTLSEPRRVEENVAHVTFYSEPATLDANFRIVWTANRALEKGEKCRGGEFLCDEGTCIDMSLTCDGNENCEQRNDETGKNICTKVDKFAMLRKEHVIGILVLACGMITGICVLTCMRCQMKLRLHKEHMKRLKERRFNEGSMSASFGSSLGAQIAQRKSDGLRQCADEITTEDCHVPDDSGIALDVMGNKYPNGGRSISRNNSKKLIMDSSQDDMKKMQHYAYDHSNCDPPPPPPPPHRFRDWSSQIDGSNQCAIHSNRTPNPGMYKSYISGTPDDSEMDNDSIPPAPPPPTSRPPKTGRPPAGGANTPSTRSPQHFRAEAVIEMSQQDQRPRSFESAKSAPDVIVTH